MMIDVPILRVKPFITNGARWYDPPVRAELIDIAPHLPHGTWCVHKSKIYGQGNWVVTNVETGMHVADNDDKDVAIAMATARLAVQTAESQEQAYAAALPDVRIAEGAK
jgi:hypothetical protein